MPSGSNPISYVILYRDTMEIYQFPTHFKYSSLTSIRDAPVCIFYRFQYQLIGRALSADSNTNTDIQSKDITRRRRSNRPKTAVKNMISLEILFRIVENLIYLFLYLFKLNFFYILSESSVVSSPSMKFF